MGRARISRLHSRISNIISRHFGGLDFRQCPGRILILSRSTFFVFFQNRWGVIHKRRLQQWERGSSKSGRHIWFHLTVFNFLNMVRGMTQESINVPCNWWITYFSDQKVRSIFDQQFWTKIPLSEVYKNCVSDQIQLSEMTKTFGHYCSLKML